MPSMFHYCFFLFSTLTLCSQMSLGAAIPRDILSRDTTSAPLAKRLFERKIGSPFTQVKAGSSLPIVGENMNPPNVSTYTLSVTLDSAPVGTFSNVPFTSDSFRLHVTIPATTTDGTHQICVAIPSEQVQYCMEMLVCSSNCQPTLGFLDADKLSSPSATSRPSDGQFTFVGDAFKADESLSLSLDIPSFPGNQHLMNIDTDDTGRFEVELSVTGLSLGVYTINVEGQGSSDSASAHFTLANVENL